jgi:hypothetical protein
LGKKLGGLYLGAYYGGFLFKEGSDTLTTTITKDYDTSSDPAVELFTNTVVRYNSDPSTKTLNRLDVLLGVGKMGFRLGLQESINATDKPYLGYNDSSGLTVKNNTEYANGNISKSETTDYSYMKGSFIPSLDFGIVLGSDEGVKIKPQVRGAFGLNFDDIAYTTILSVTGGASTETEWTRAYGNVRPDIKLGADVDLPSGLTFSLFYTLGLNIYSKPDAGDGIDREAGTAYWSKAVQTNATGVVTTYDVTSAELTGSSHSIEPAISWKKSLGEGDAFKLGVRFYVPVTFEFLTSKGKTVTTTETETIGVNPRYLSSKSVQTTNQSDTETSSINIAPDLEVGGSYHVTPKFAVNAGVTFSPISWKQITTLSKPTDFDNTKTTQYNQYGDKTGETVFINGTTTTDEQRITNTLSGVSFSLGLGATFNLTDNIALDILAINGSWSSAENWAAVSGLVLSAKF